MGREQVVRRPGLEPWTPALLRPPAGRLAMRPRDLGDAVDKVRVVQLDRRADGLEALLPARLLSGEGHEKGEHRRRHCGSVGEVSLD